VRCYGQYGTAGMMLLIMQIMLNSCRLFAGLHIGSIYGLSSFRRSNRDIWILDAHVWWRSFGLSSAEVVGSILTEYKMHSVVLYSFFRWFIHIATLNDAWDVITLNTYIFFLIKWPRVSFWCRGRVTHFFKKAINRYP
jgi:hypothetical protein